MSSLTDFPVAQNHGGIGKVGVGENTEDTGRRARHHAGAGKKLFLGIVESVSPTPLDVVEILPVDLQPGLFSDEPVDRGLVDL